MVGREDNEFWVFGWYFNGSSSIYKWGYLNGGYGWECVEIFVWGFDGESFCMVFYL